METVEGRQQELQFPFSGHNSPEHLHTKQEMQQLLFHRWPLTYFTFLLQHMVK